MKILISGYYGFGNVGDEAVLQGAIDGLQDIAPGSHISVLSLDPDKTKHNFHVDAIPRNDFFTVLRAISHSDVFISGGGTLFQDSTSIRSVLYYLFLMQMALWMRKKVVVFAQGFGPIRSSITHYLLQTVLRRVHLILLRDPKALHEMEKSGISGPPIHVTGDPAFLLKPAAKNEIAKLLEREGIVLDGRPIAAICVRKLVRTQSLAEQEQMRVALAKTADYLVTERGMRVVFVNFQPRTDVEEAIRILNLMTHTADVILREYLPSELLGFLGEAHLVIGMRLHALIFASSMGTPFIGLSYDPKVSGFVEQMEQVWMDAGTLDAVRLLSSVQKILSERNSMSLALNAKREEMIRNAKKNFEELDTFFKHVASKNITS